MTSRDALACAHIRFVRRTAGAVAHRLPDYVHITSDLVGAGMIGLMEAAARYRPETHVPFEAFARRRVRGAMLDALRDWDPLTRIDRRNRPDFHPEVPLETLHEAQKAWVSPAPRPDEAWQDRQLRARTRAALRRLPARERQIVLWYYGTDMNQAAIGRRLGLHESRVSQLRTAALRTLRRHLEEGPCIPAPAISPC